MDQPIPIQWIPYTTFMPCVVYRRCLTWVPHVPVQPIQQFPLYQPQPVHVPNRDDARPELNQASHMPLESAINTSPPRLAEGKEKSSNGNQNKRESVAAVSKASDQNKEKIKSKREILETKSIPIKATSKQQIASSATNVSKKPESREKTKKDKELYWMKLVECATSSEIAPVVQQSTRRKKHVIPQMSVDSKRNKRMKQKMRREMKKQEKVKRIADIPPRVWPVKVEPLRRSFDLETSAKFVQVMRDRLLGVDRFRAMHERFNQLCGNDPFQSLYVFLQSVYAVRYILKIFRELGSTFCPPSLEIQETVAHLLNDHVPMKYQPDPFFSKEWCGLHGDLKLSNCTLTKTSALSTLHSLYLAVPTDALIPNDCLMRVPHYDFVNCWSFLPGGAEKNFLAFNKSEDLAKRCLALSEMMVFKEELVYKLWYGLSNMDYGSNAILCDFLPTFLVMNYEICATALRRLTCPDIWSFMKVVCWTMRLTNLSDILKLNCTGMELEEWFDGVWQKHHCMWASSVPTDIPTPAPLHLIKELELCFGNNRDLVVLVLQYWKEMWHKSCILGTMNRGRQILRAGFLVS